MKAKVPSYSYPIALEPERYWKEGIKEGREGGRRREGKGREGWREEFIRYFND